MGGQGDPLEIVQEIKICSYNKWYMHKLESILEDEAHKILWDFEVLIDPLIPTRRLDIVLINKKNKTKKQETKNKTPNV